MSAGIREVAAAAGVSTATVSRVLSGTGRVSPETRGRVLAAAERLRYVPHAGARGLRRTSSMVIGVLVPDLTNAAVLPFVRGVSSVASRRGYAILIADAQRDAATERLDVDRMHAQRVDALILAGEPRDPRYLRALRGEGLNVVGLDESTGGELHGAARSRRAIQSMFDHLVSLGHSRVAYVTRATPRRLVGSTRLRTILEVGRRSGLHVEHVRMQRPSGVDPAGAALTERLSGQGPRTAVIASTHLVAPQLLRTLAGSGLELPGDCSFVTFGDSDWAQAHVPALNVIRRDLFGLARSVTTAVLDGIDAGSRTETPAVALPVAFDAEYVRRESVGPAPAG